MIKKKKKTQRMWLVGLAKLFADAGAFRPQPEKTADVFSSDHR